MRNSVAVSRQENSGWSDSLRYRSGALGLSGTRSWRADGDSDFSDGVVTQTLVFFHAQGWVGRRVPSPPCAWQAHGKLPSCLHASSLSTRRAGDCPPYPGTTKPVVLTLRCSSARASPTDCTNSSPSKSNRTRCTCRPPARGGASRSDCTNSSRKTSIRRIRSASRRPGAHACPTGCKNSFRRTSIRRIGISNSFRFLSEAFASCFLLARRRRRHPPASNGKMVFFLGGRTRCPRRPSLQYSRPSNKCFHLSQNFISSPFFSLPARHPLSSMSSFPSLVPSP